MNKYAFLKKAEHQNHNNSLENYHQKSKEKSPEKGRDYNHNLQNIIGETYGRIKYKLNQCNLQFGVENQNQELKYNSKYRNLKRIMKKDQIIVKDKKIKKKENSKENLNFINPNLTKTESDYNYDIQTNIIKYFKNRNNIFGKKTPDYESHLDELWKKLGVNSNYINNFNQYKNIITNQEEKENFLINEIENLEKVKDILMNLRKDIKLRETKLIELKNLFERLNNENNFINVKKILNESNFMINSYLENSIRVVEYYLLYREMTNKGSYKNLKFNKEIIKQNFEINANDMNYLLKMKTDTNFINNLKLNGIKINKDIFNLFKADPFLSCLNYLIQIPNEIKEKIKYCQYYLIQEEIFDSIKKMSKEPKSKSARKNSQSHIKIDAAILKKNLIIEESKNGGDNNNIFANMNSNMHSIHVNENINNYVNQNVNPNIHDNLNISYFSGKLTEFMHIYSDYYEKIPEEQKIIFNLNKDPLKYLEHNFYPKIIICQDKVTNIIKGLCIYSIKFRTHEKKPNEIILEHISSYNKEEMENILTKLIEFLKDNHILRDLFSNEKDLVTEIYLDLHYYLVNNKFEIDKNIRDFISKKLKFKWVKLENISKVIRFQKMKQIIHCSDIKASIRSSINSMMNDNINDNNYLWKNFSIKDNFIINFVQKIANNSEEIDAINIMKKINPFNIFYLIYIKKKIQNIKNSFDFILSKINTYFSSYKLLNEIPMISDENNNNNNNSNNNELNIYSIPADLKVLSECFNSKFENEISVGNKIDIFPLFDGCISLKYENYFYNRIECKDIRIVKENSTEQIFYFMNAVNNENIRILISSNLNDNFKNKYLNNKDENNSNINISLSFKEIYNNLIECQSEEEQNKNNYLFIPAFSLEQKYELKNNNIENQKEENVINNINEDYKIEFLPEDLIIKRNNKVSNNFEFNIVGDEIKNRRDSIINDEFMIFILDIDMIDNIGIIPLMSIHVHKENFIPDSFDE